MILYSAEANAASKEVDIASRKSHDGLQAWEYRAPLGEKFAGQIEPSVFLIQFNVKSRGELRICCLAAAKDEKDAAISTALFGQAVFSSSGKEVYLTAYPTLLDGRRLGIIYCSNRPSVIFKAPIDFAAGGSIKDADAVKNKLWHPSEWSRLSSLGFSARNPRAKSTGGCIWLQAEQGGAHNDCDSLVSSDSKGTITEEISIVDIPDLKSPFPGLYATSLKRSCVMDKSQMIMLDTIWGSNRAVVAHQVGSKLLPSAISQATASQDTPLWSYAFLCSDGSDTVLATRSSPLHPQQVVIATISSVKDDMDWKVVYDAASQWRDEQGESNYDACC